MTVRQRHEIPSLEVDGVLARHVQPAFAGEDDVKLGVFLVRLDADSPRGGGLDAAVTGGANPNRFEHVREHVCRRHRTPKQEKGSHYR
jgi:hypothetical protein